MNGDCGTSDRSAAKIISRFPKGEITPPPSKSLSHRAVICALLAGMNAADVLSSPFRPLTLNPSSALAGGGCVENFARSDDVDATLAGMSALTGIETRLDGNTLRLSEHVGATAPGRPNITAPDRPNIDCDESGSTLRFLLPIAAAVGRGAVFTGRGRLLHRPLEAYEKVFAEGGAIFERDDERVTVKGPLKSGSYSLPGDVSSQFVSGLLLALPLLDGGSEVRVSAPLESKQYVDMTIGVMAAFGVGVEADCDTGGELIYRVRGGQRYRPARFRVEADFSQAAFFLAAAALGADVRVAGLSPESAQGDKVILDALREAGASVIWKDGVVSVSASKRLSAITFDARDAPDLVPPVAALCCFCDGVSRIVNAARLRLKESDRLRALTSELRKLGAEAEESGDSLSITGAERLKGGGADAWGDHRIAMAVAAAAIRCDNPVQLTGWGSVSKSYPNFWRDFEGDVQ
jgi:3-phosphoshikimate 1-carboxyvinyltransferase